MARNIVQETISTKKRFGKAPGIRETVPSGNEARNSRMPQPHPSGGPGSIDTNEPGWSNKLRKKG